MLARGADGFDVSGPRRVLVRGLSWFHTGWFTRGTGCSERVRLSCAILKQWQTAHQ
jgi:hypothetical protein